MFDEEQILEQWLTPNEWETRASPDSKKRTQHFHVTMQIQKEKFIDPSLLIAAALRLGFEAKFEGGEAFPISFSIEDPNLNNEIKTPDYYKLSIKSSESESIINGTMQCSFEELEKDKYTITAKVLPNNPESSWSFPIKFSIYSNPTMNAKNDSKATVNISLSILYDQLDCGTASLMLKAKNSRQANIFFKLSDDIIFQLPETIKDGLGMSISDNQAKIIKKLGIIQSKLNRKIDFPFAGLPLEIINEIQNIKIRTIKDAQNALELIGRFHEKNNKPEISTLTFEIYEGKNIIERHYLDYNDGLHEPRITFISKNPDDKQRFNEALDNPAMDCSFTSAIRLSPLATLEYLKNNQFEMTDISCRSVIEYKSLVRFEWQPQTETFWYYITPTVHKLYSISQVERWFNEADYLSTEMKDFRRAYIAAKEAHRISNKSPEATIRLGWQAFLLDRYDECISVTNDVVETENWFRKYIANINLGLSHLAAANKEQSSSANHLQKAESHYKSALNVLSNLSEQDIPFAIGEASNDIDEFRNILHNKADDIREDFSKFS